MVLQGQKEIAKVENEVQLDDDLARLGSLDNLEEEKSISMFDLGQMADLEDKLIKKPSPPIDI